MVGRGPFGYFWVLQKVTRCKSGTNSRRYPNNGYVLRPKRSSAQHIAIAGKPAPTFGPDFAWRSADEIDFSAVIIAGLGPPHRSCVWLLLGHACSDICKDSSSPRTSRIVLRRCRAIGPGALCTTTLNPRSMSSLTYLAVTQLSLLWSFRWP